MATADALRDAFWIAMPSQARRIDERELWTDLAEHGLTCGRAAYRYGDRGELLIRNVASNLRTKFNHLHADVLEKQGPKAAHIDFEAKENAVWIACARALLDAAQEEAKSRSA